MELLFPKCWIVLVVARKKVVHRPRPAGPERAPGARSKAPTTVFCTTWLPPWLASADSGSYWSLTLSSYSIVAPEGSRRELWLFRPLSALAPQAPGAATYATPVP